MSEMNTCRARVYKGSRREGVYLYLDPQRDPEAIPPELAGAMGDLTLVIELELNPGRKLASEDVVQVMANLATRGYHLQLPPAGSAADAPADAPASGSMG